MRKYGKLTFHSGTEIGGYTLDEIIRLANACDEQEVEISELTGDAAIIPAVLRDLVKHIKELDRK